MEKLTSTINEANLKLKNNKIIQEQIQSTMSKDVGRIKKELFQKELALLVDRIKNEYQVKVDSKEPLIGDVLGVLGDSVDLANRKSETVVDDAKYIYGGMMSSPIMGESFSKSLKLMGTAAISSIAVGSVMATIAPNVLGAVSGAMELVTILGLVLVFITIIFIGYFVFYNVIIPIYDTGKQLAVYIKDAAEMIVKEIVRLISDLVVMVIDAVNTYVVTPIVEASITIANEIVSLTKTLQPIPGKIIDAVSPIFKAVNDFIEPVTDVAFDIKYTIEQALDVIAGPISQILERLEIVKRMIDKILGFASGLAPDTPLELDQEFGPISIGGTLNGIKNSWPCGWSKYKCLPEVGGTVNDIPDMNFANLRLKFPGDSMIEGIIKGATFGAMDLDFGDLTLPGPYKMCNKCEMFMWAVRSGKLSELTSILNNPFNVVEFIGDAMKEPCGGVIPCAIDLPSPLPNIDIGGIVNAAFGTVFGSIF
jgi:hypothetical protein